MNTAGESDWEFDFAWLKLRHEVKELMKLDKLPDFKSILFVIGIQELGQVRTKFSKEEKKDLMHIAVCKLLSFENYYIFEGLDQDGWPHYKELRAFQQEGVIQQERYLKKAIIKYFEAVNANL